MMISCRKVHTYNEVAHLEESAAHAANTPSTSPQPCCRPTSADINMQFLSGSCWAVFTCRLSHVILQERTLILLHCPSTVNSCTKSTSFHSILTARQTNSRPLWFQRLEMRLGARGNHSDPYHNFLSHPPGDVPWFTTFSLPFARPTLPPSPSFSPSDKLCYWCVLIWRVNTHWCDTAFSYYSKPSYKGHKTFRKLCTSLSSVCITVLFAIFVYLPSPVYFHTSHFFFLNLPLSFSSSF